MELRCPSLEYVNAMTWAEFQLRLEGYRREQERLDLRERETAYSSYIGGSLMLKKVPKKNQFWKIGESDSEVTELMRKRTKEAIEKFHKEKLNKANG